MGVVDGNHEREVLMGQTQDEIGPSFAEDFPFLEVFDDCRAVMGIDDPVTFVEHEYPLLCRKVRLRLSKRVARGVSAPQAKSAGQRPYCAFWTSRLSRMPR